MIKKQLPREEIVKHEESPATANKGDHKPSNVSALAVTKVTMASSAPKSSLMTLKDN